jgi:hypothetical protein
MAEPLWWQERVRDLLIRSATRILVYLGCDLSNPGGAVDFYLGGL